MSLACAWVCQKYGWLHELSHIGIKTTEFNQKFHITNNVYPNEN